MTKPVQIQTLVRVLYDDGKCATVAIPWMEAGVKPDELVEEQMTLIKDTLTEQGYAKIHESATTMNEKQRQAVETRANQATQYNRQKAADNSDG